MNVASLVGPACDGPVTIVVCGAAASTVQSHSAGVSSSTPSAFRARTYMVWSPSASPVTSYPEMQGTNAPASSAHSKLEPAWSDENVKLALDAAVSDSGPVSIVVSGRATRRQLRVAGVGSGFPAASIARTANVCSPSSSAGYWTAESHGSQLPSSSRHSNVVSVSEAVNVSWASGLP